MNLDGLRISVFKNAYKKQDNHPDYNIVVKNGDDIVAEGGAYIATDKQTGQKKRDKNGNTFMIGKLKNPRQRDSRPAGNTGYDQAEQDKRDGDVPF